MVSIIYDNIISIHNLQYNYIMPYITSVLYIYYLCIENYIHMYYINYIYTVSVRHPQITELPEMLVNYDNSDSARWTGFSNAWHVMFCPEPHCHP